METAFNFESFKKVERIITRDFGDAGLTRSKGKNGKTLFRFSQKAFDDLSLKLNSLEALTDGKVVVVKVMPGNEGDFMTARTGKDKGKKTTHNELGEMLNTVGLTGNKFNLERIETTDFYKIVPVAEEAAPKKKRVKKEAAPAEAAVQA